MLMKDLIYNCVSRNSIVMKHKQHRRITYEVKGGGQEAKTHLSLILSRSLKCSLYAVQQNP